MNYILVAVALQATLSVGMDNLKVVYSWKQLDFDFPSPQAREEAIATKEFIPEHNLPLGLEVFGDRLFVTVPRWKSGVAASLNYINLNTSGSAESPKLKPYPGWGAHKLQAGAAPAIVSPFRIKADACGKLWVLDTGIADLLGNTTVLAPTRLLVYSLDTDTLVRSYSIPEGQLKADSFLANIAVEDAGDGCDDSFAYLGDLGKPGVIVYSWRSDRSWRIEHPYFNIDPLEGEFNVSGVVFQWSDGVFGLALSKPDREGFSTLYFHPLTSTNEFSVSTKHLRDENRATNATAIYHEFRHLGSRGVKGQSSVSFLDQKTDVLFYALVNLNAIACWRTTNPAYTMESQGRVYMSNEHMVFPNDIKVDAANNLWVLSDRLPEFMYTNLDFSQVNFRILTAPVAAAIKGTACDSRLVVSPDVMEKIKPPPPPNTANTQQQRPASSASAGVALPYPTIVFILHYLVFLWKM